jgi:hypothetical protein
MAEMARVARGCRCGATLTATVRPPSLAGPLVAAWNSLHTGRRCQPVNLQIAAAERRKRVRMGLDMAGVSRG